MRGFFAGHAKQGTQPPKPSFTLLCHWVPSRSGRIGHKLNKRLVSNTASLTGMSVCLLISANKAEVCSLGASGYEYMYMYLHVLYTYFYAYSQFIASHSLCSRHATGPGLPVSRPLLGCQETPTGLVNMASQSIFVLGGQPWTHCSCLHVTRSHGSPDVEATDAFTFNKLVA